MEGSVLICEHFGQQPGYYGQVLALIVGREDDGVLFCFGHCGGGVLGRG